jgi:hypothetical protein
MLIHEYMDVAALRRQGFMIAEMADELGYHPATISGWLKATSARSGVTSSASARSAK